MTNKQFLEIKSKLDKIIELLEKLGPSPITYTYEQVIEWQSQDTSSST